MAGMVSTVTATTGTGPLAGDFYRFAELLTDAERAHLVLDHGVATFFADAGALHSFEGTREINTLVVGRAIIGHSAFA
jgi:alkylation response protein AidB-like acyl-CoA dehydrogenase